MKLQLLIPNSYKSEEVDIEVGDTLYHNNAGGYYLFEVIEILEKDLKLRYLGRDQSVTIKSFDVLYNHGWHKENTIFIVEAIEPPANLWNEYRIWESTLNNCSSWIYHEPDLYACLSIMGIKKYFRIIEPGLEHLTKISDRKIIQILIKNCSFTFAELELIIANAKWDKYQEIKAQLNKI